MPFSAQLIIRSARDVHPAFTEQQTPDASLLRRLTQYGRELRGEVVRHDKQRIVTEETVSFPLADFDAGHTLTAHQSVIGGDVVLRNNDEHEFHVVDWSSRHGSIPYYSGWIRSGVLYFRENAAWWNGVTSVVLSYIPSWDGFAVMSDTIDLDDRAQTPMIAEAANFMAGRGQGESNVPIRTREMYAAREEAHDKYMRELTDYQAAETRFTTEVW